MGHAEWPYRRWLSDGNKPPQALDLDLMTPDERRAWRMQFPLGVPITEGAAMAFPDRPPGYVQAFRGYMAIISRMEHGLPCKQHYAQLPEWAKWRNRFPVEACTLPGKRFKKRVKSDPLKLLALVPAKRKRRSNVG
jgi:hypothetical protein